MHTCTILVSCIIIISPIVQKLQNAARRIIETKSVHVCINQLYLALIVNCACMGTDTGPSASQDVTLNFTSEASSSAVED